MTDLLELARKESQQLINRAFAGESGTGKGIIAKLYIKTASRKDGPFIRASTALPSPVN
jgi:DNA-binding NtrC family response regulator